MTRKCSLCSTPNHNLTTCPHLAFRQEQAHRLYIHLWQNWVKSYFIQEQTENDDYYPNRYVSVSNFYIANFLKDSTNFRLLKSYLNLAGRGTELEIKSYIYGLYHYLVLQKLNKFEEYARHNNLNPNRYRYYDHLLVSVPDMVLPHENGKRNYGITVSMTIPQQQAQEQQQQPCPICYEDTNNVIKTNCGHSFCQSCVTQTISILPNNKPLCCAMCRTQVTHLDCCTNVANLVLKRVLNLSSSSS